MRLSGPTSARLAPLALAIACTPSAPEAPASATTTVARWEPAPDPEEREATGAPLDPRRVRLDASAYEGTERTCDVVFRGEEEALGAIAGRAYEPPRTRRIGVRCRGATGTGWADLVFDEASAGLAELVAVGQRLTVRVEAGRGHRGAPVLAFVAFQSERRPSRPAAPSPRTEVPRLSAPLVGETRERPRDEGAEALLAEVPVGEDWAQVPAPGQTPRACALLSVGEPDPVPEGAGYAPDATHHLPVRCRGPRGSVRVDVTFSSHERLASLRFRRGEVVPLRPVARLGSGVRARYAGP